MAAGHRLSPIPNVLVAMENLTIRPIRSKKGKLFVDEAIK